MFFKIFIASFVCLLSSLHALKIDRVIVWGHKLHTHTHSYIHYGFYKAFKYLGYQVDWFDDKSYPSNFDFSNTLFIVAHNQDSKVPLREDCYYIYHHCWCKEHQCARERYGQLIDMNRCISIKCFWRPYLEENDPDWKFVETFIYKNYKQKECVFPWATDLLPHEIDREKQNLNKLPIKNQVCFIGTISNAGTGENKKAIDGFLNQAKRHGLQVITSNPWVSPISNEISKQIMQESLLAPAIQGYWQRDEGYIPCRIFKAISYGKMGITNSKYVNMLFDNRLVYNPDTRKLFHDSIKALKVHTTKKQLELMDYVRDHHTYVHRIHFLINFLMELNHE